MGTAITSPVTLCGRTPETFTRQRPNTLR